MPRKTDLMAVGCPFLDKRIKLLPCQIERMIALHKEGWSQRKLAAHFGVSRRTVQFKIDPDKLEANIDKRHDRGGWKQYYNREDHRKYQKKHRDNKKELFTGKSHLKTDFK